MHDNGPKRRLSGRGMDFAAVYEDHHGFVWQTLRCLGVVDSALEDAVQDVFIVVHRRLPEFEGRASIKTWLFEIVRRVASRYRTKASRDAARHFELPELRSDLDLDEAVERALAGEMLRAFVDRLDEDKLPVFMLAEFGQLRGREISEALGININTVFARLRSAREQLDRMAVRLRARESASLIAAARRARPSGRSQRRTWGLLVAKLGLGAASAPVPLAATGVASQLKWLVAGGLTAALGVATVTVATANEPPPKSAPPAAVAAVEPAPAPVAPAVRPAAVPTVVAEAVPPPDPVAAPPQRPASPTEPAAEPSPDLLAQEVAYVRATRAAVTGGAADARERLRRYDDRFPQGRLRLEMDALALELQCRAGEAGAAELEAFARRHRGSSLARAWLRCVRKKSFHKNREAPRLSRCDANEIEPARPRPACAARLPRGRKVRGRLRQGRAGQQRRERGDRRVHAGP